MEGGSKQHHDSNEVIDNDIILEYLLAPLQAGKSCEQGGHSSRCSLQPYLNPTQL